LVVRPYWKGYLKFALVSCPIALQAACSTAQRVAFRQVNKATGNRLCQQLIDEETGAPVAPQDRGRGYEVARGHYLIVSDEELDAIEIASTHTIEIDSFVPPASRRDQRKSPAKRRAGPAFGYAGDGLPSRCIRRYRLPSRCTRKKFHARPEQGNGPAADGASFSLTLKFIGVRKEPLFPSGTKTIRGLGNRSARFHHPHHRKRSHR
jgi:hypothetical protein